MKWKQIPQYPNYDCSNTGLIRNRTSGRISVGTITNRGYIAVSISINGIKQTIQPHRFVASLFVKNPENKPFVNHKDGNKTNNHFTNLEWCTHIENMRHASAVLNREFGRKNSKKVRCIETGIIYNSSKEAERLTNVWNSHINQCCTGKRNTAGGYHFEYA